MGKIEIYFCDSCKNPILKPTDGFVVKGNIYVASPVARGGLIGNNFPEAESFSTTDVKETVMCQSCFVRALSIEMPHLHYKPGIRGMVDDS